MNCQDLTCSGDRIGRLESRLSILDLLLAVAVLVVNCELCHHISVCVDPLIGKMDGDDGLAAILTGGQDERSEIGYGGGDFVQSRFDTLVYSIRSRSIMVG